MPSSTRLLVTPPSFQCFQKFAYNFITHLHFKYYPAIYKNGYSKPRVKELFPQVDSEERNEKHKEKGFVRGSGF